MVILCLKILLECHSFYFHTPPCTAILLVKVTGNKAITYIPLDATVYKAFCLLSIYFQLERTAPSYTRKLLSIVRMPK